jgi:hypothetical protein
MKTTISSKKEMLIYTSTIQREVFNTEASDSVRTMTTYKISTVDLKSLKRDYRLQSSNEISVTRIEISLHLVGNKILVTRLTSHHPRHLNTSTTPTWMTMIDMVLKNREKALHQLTLRSGIAETWFRSTTIGLVLTILKIQGTTTHQQTEASEMPEMILLWLSLVSRTKEFLTEDQLEPEPCLPRESSLQN